jgi:hypothetical protein
MKFLLRHRFLRRLVGQRRGRAAKVAAWVLAMVIGVALSFGVLYFVVAYHVGLD